MVIPESVLKKRWREERWALQKKEELETKWKDCENRMLIFNRACRKSKKIQGKRKIEKKLIQPKWEAKVNGGFYVCPEAKAYVHH
ncbi:hypothetical protein HPP92_016802 [Vanilla planifolia]|uniref:Large ribosomal subunit protein uL30 N-terminal eukaryotes domain-containing protein n=1 Tax=Vanilla planifolia TaxID=51239 RepID=A0A835UUJ6_VANPL|nr:hypothetical protein HPP92_017432 [Vanilla planifolia]KAG0472256.1 hypothetical protein HPP92_016802 [Vanilla planifolia]